MTGEKADIRRDPNVAHWILRRRPNPGASLRLFCLPHAGGDTWMFQDWQIALPASVEVCPIRLPGRGSRIADPPFTDLQALVEALSHGLVDSLDRPFAIFGHSMGALIGFELARHLRRTGRRSPVMLCAASCRAPQLTGSFPAISHLPPYLMLESLQRRYGTGADLVENDELMQLMLPVIRADFSICETYSYVEREPLDCPIAAYGGTADTTVDVVALDAWETQTTDAFLRHAIVGDHFFPIGSKSDLLQILSEDLAWAVS